MACLLLGILLPAFPAFVRAGETLEELRGVFERETDPVRRAKLVEKLGNAQFDAAARAIREENYLQAGQLVEEYRDAVRKAHEGLKASGRVAGKDHAGFKQLEIHLRKSIRKLEQMITYLPVNWRPPFELRRNELEAADKELLEALFPRRPGAKENQTKKGKP